MAHQSQPNTTSEAQFPQANKLARNLKVAKWLRRGGYACVLAFILWVLIYPSRGASLYRAGAEQDAAKWLEFARGVSTIILRVAAGLIGLGILIPVAERVRHSKLNTKKLIR